MYPAWTSLLIAVLLLPGAAATAALAVVAGLFAVEGRIRISQKYRRN